MRLWLKDSERRPDPQIRTTDDRKAVMVGLVGWLAALIALLLFRDQVVQAGNGWWLFTCAIGIALGLLGLVYLGRRR